MKITMNVENVALTMAQPSQVSVRLHAILNGKRGRRPVTRWTMAALFVSTGVILPLLAAAQTSQAADKRAVSSAQSTEQDKSVPSLNNLTALGYELGYACQETDMVIPSMSDAATVKKELSPYVVNVDQIYPNLQHSDDIFVNPDTQRPYLPNPSLTGQKWDLAAKDEVVAFYEDAPAADGTRGVLFLPREKYDAALKAVVADPKDWVRRIPEKDWPKIKQQSHIPD